MKQRLIDSISNPGELENLYRENKQEFTKSFHAVADEYDSDLVKFWKIRLASETEPVAKEFMPTDLVALIVLALISGILVKLPEIFSQLKEEFFYTRDVVIIVFNGLILYTFWQNRDFGKKNVTVYGIFLLVLTLFVNLLPGTKSDAEILALIHSPLLLWCVFGLAYISFDYKNTAKRIAFIRFNGEIIIMTGLILLAGGLLTGITVGLFSAIKMNIHEFYFEYIAMTGAVVSPMVAFYLIRMYPNNTSKIAPVIARVFTPLVLITLAVYLVSLTFSTSNILEDRDLLILFNVMLLAVLAIIVFSISELDKTKEKNFNVLILFLLASLAIVINSIALIAIITRVTNGLTPNRTVVLFSNVLIFLNLVLIAKDLYLSYFKRKNPGAVEQTVARYLTVYALWTVIVIFVLPFIFGMK